MQNFFKNAQEWMEDLSEDQQAIIKGIWGFIGAIVLGVVVYSEYMFIGIISVALPDGINKYAAIIGAVATGASVVFLVLAKKYVIKPGLQHVWSWLFTGIEVTVMVLNDVLAYALHHPPLSDQLATWQSLTPASPVIALVGWILIIFLDNAQRMKHRRLEMEARKQKAEIGYEEAAHKAEMHLRGTHLNQVVARLQDVMNSPQIQQRIVNHAERMVDKVLSDVSGIVAQDVPQIVESQQPVQLAQQASTPVQPVTQAHDTDYAAYLAWKQQQEQPSSPLAMAPLTTGNQESNNGNGKH